MTQKLPADQEPKPQSPRDSDHRDRRAANIFLLVAAIVVIAAGVWLVDAMVAARKADECISTGRRNC